MCMACNPGMRDFFRMVVSRRDLLHGIGLGGVVATAAAFGISVPALSADAAIPEGAADTIFHGGPIITINDAAPRAEALAVKAGRIAAVGTRADIEKFRGPETKVVDLGGKTLLPGFIDAHIHFSMILLDDFMDLGANVAPSMDALLGILKAEVQKAKPGEWIRGQLFDALITEGGRPLTLDELEALAPNNPVFIWESNGHVAYVNNAAYKIADVTKDTPDPPQGRFVRGSDGELTGRIEESPSYRPFLATMPQTSGEEFLERIMRIMNKAAAMGCTGLHDNGIGLATGVGDLTLLQTVMSKPTPVRVRGMLSSEIAATWERMNLKPGFGDDRFRIRGMKAWSDGSNQGKTGYLREPYLNDTSRGALNYTPEALTAAVRTAHKAGWQVGVHANGDAGIDIAIDAFETVLKEMPRDDHRHRIEHCTILRPEQIARMAKLGLSPSFLIGHVKYWGKAYRDVLIGPERADFLDPCASALAAGLRVSLHSDYNVTQINPLEMVETAVTRILHQGGDVLNPKERIPVMAALKAVTLDAAWQCGMDDITGSLEVGKYADLVVLEKDPTAVEPTAIRAIKVSETWLEGTRQFVG